MTQSCISKHLKIIVDKEEKWKRERKFTKIKQKSERQTNWLFG